MSKHQHVSVRLFTFNNRPKQELWNHYQLWVGGLVRGRGIYVTKPETNEEDEMMRRTLHNLHGFRENEVEDIMNYIYKKL